MPDPKASLNQRQQSNPRFHALIYQGVSRVLSLVTILLFGIAPSLLAQERQIATYSGFSGSLGPQWVSVDQRLFEKYGSKIEWVLMTGAVRGTQALVSGSANYYTGDPVAAISVSLQGGDIVIIGTMLNRIVGSLVARKEIREPSDLRRQKNRYREFRWRH